jgi:hypothetical protein
LNFGKATFFSKIFARISLSSLSPFFKIYNKALTPVSFFFETCKKFSISTKLSSSKHSNSSVIFLGGPLYKKWTSNNIFIFALCRLIYIFMLTSSFVILF